MKNFAIACCRWRSRLTAKLQHLNLADEPAASAVVGKLSATMQVQHRLRMSTARSARYIDDEQPGSIEVSAEDTSRPVRDVGIR